MTSVTICIIRDSTSSYIKECPLFYYCVPSYIYTIPLDIGRVVKIGGFICSQLVCIGKQLLGLETVLQWEMTFQLKSQQPDMPEV